MPRPKKNKQAGEAFKELLRQKGFTQYKLVQATGLDKGLISKIANGQTAEPKPTTLEKIATALGVELGELTKIFAQPPMRSRSSQSAEAPLPQQSDTLEETTSENSDSVTVRGEGALADSNSEDLDDLVQKVRSHFEKTIQNHCETLYTFNLLYTPMCGNLSRIYVQSKLNQFQHFGSVEFSQAQQLWDKVVLKNPMLMVLGKPGAGKTTLLQYIAVHCDEVEFQPKQVPVFVSLKNLAETARRADELSLLGYIQKKYCRSDVSEQELETLLSHGRLLFLLDGLDEVPHEKIRAVSKEIYTLVDEYGDNRFIVSCRKEFQAYKSKQFGSFLFCKVADFESQQIENFINNWFDEVTVNTQKEQSIKATQLIEKLRLPENQRIRELSNTPLLLHLICLIFQNRGDFPSKRVDLYKEGIDLLLTRWNQFNERTQTNTSDIDLVELRTALRQIAAITLEQGKSSFEEGEISLFLESCPRTLSDIEVLSGLLVKKKWQTYAFSHQTFQEYLTAEEFVNSRPGWQKMLTHIGEARWREVFLLTVEMLPNTEKFLRLIKQGFLNLRTEYDNLDDAELGKELDTSNPEISYWRTPSMSDVDLQVFLIQANEKSCAVTNYCKPAAIRSFYFSCGIILTNFIVNRENFDGSVWVTIDKGFELACAIDCNFRASPTPDHSLGRNLEVDYRLIIAFSIASELAQWCIHGDIKLSEAYSVYELTCDLDSKLNFPIPFSVAHKSEIYPKQLCLFVEEETKTKTESFFDVPYDFLQSLQQLKTQIPLHTLRADEDLYRLVDWWEYHGGQWVESLRNLIIQHRNMGHKQCFDYYEYFEVLEQYYKANKLLVDCLNTGCKVPEEVRSYIEENLFLPIGSSLL